MNISLGSAGTTAWTSFLLKADVAGGQGISLRFWDSSEDTVTIGTLNNDFLITRNGSTVDASWINNVVNDGETYYLVAKIEFTSGADTVSLYVNPTPGLATPDVAAGAVLNIADLGTFAEIGMIGGGSGNTSTVDEIRVGDTFADVAPGSDYYLDGIGDGSDIPTAALKPTAPVDTTLDNFDPGRDAFAGLMVDGSDLGINEVDITEYQQWITPADGIRLNGHASLSLWSAMKDFDVTKAGSISAYMVDTDATGSDLCR